MSLPPAAAAATIKLLRGPIDRERDESHWQALDAHYAAIHDYLAVIDLELLRDEGDGFAFLRQREPEPDEEHTLPRLISARPLSYDQSLMLVGLRARLLDHDSWGGDGDARPTISRADLLEQFKVHFPEGQDETKLAKRVDTLLGKAVELGVLRKMKRSGDSEQRYEIRPILKALVNADWLAQFNAAMEASAAQVDDA